MGLQFRGFGVLHWPRSVGPQARQVFCQANETGEVHGQIQLHGESRTRTKLFLVTVDTLFFAIDVKIQ
jgi:hypothetical protein